MTAGAPGRRLNPFVIVRHGHVLLRTTQLSATQNPLWNEVLSLPCSSDGVGAGALGDRAQLELWHSRGGLGPDVLIAVAPGMLPLPPGIALGCGLSYSLSLSLATPPLQCLLLPLPPARARPTG